jgi:hypothetical protein
MPTKVSFTWDEMVAFSKTPEAKASLAQAMARLKARDGMPSTEDPENPWITEDRWAKAMTREQRDEYLASRRITVAVG